MSWWQTVLVCWCIGSCVSRLVLSLLVLAASTDITRSDRNSMLMALWFIAALEAWEVFHVE